VRNVMIILLANIIQVLKSRRIDGQGLWHIGGREEVNTGFW